MALSHVALTVSDRERSAAFYAEHFGLTERVHDDEHLLIIDDDAGTERQDDPGMARVQVADPDGYRVEAFAIASG